MVPEEKRRTDAQRKQIIFLHTFIHTVDPWSRRHPVHNFSHSPDETIFTVSTLQTCGGRGIDQDLYSFSSKTLTRQRMWDHHYCRLCRYPIHLPRDLLEVLDVSIPVTHRLGKYHTSSPPPLVDVLFHPSSTSSSSTSSSMQPVRSLMKRD